MNKTIIFFITAFLIIAITSFLQKDHLLSTDILLTIPQYAEEHGWNIPKNSLLSDPLFQFEPWRHYAKERLLSGEIPLINDKNSLGVPFLANQISAIFFPLNVLYYFLPTSASLFMIHALKLYFMFLFTYLYFRSIKIKRTFSLVGGILTVCLGFSIVWLEWPQTNVFLFFPLLLYLTEELRSGGKDSYLFKIGLSLTYFLIVLAGHPETAFHLGVIHFLYILFRIRHLTKIVESLAFILLGICLGAFMILPFLEYLSFSYALLARSGESPITLPIYTLIIQAFPLILGAPNLEFYRPISNSLNFQELVGGYVGLAILILGIFSAIKLKGSSLKYFWVLVLLLSLSVSYEILPLSLIGKLPLFNISANHRLIGLWGYGLIVLSVLFINERYTTKRLIFRNTKARILSTVILCGAILAMFFPFWIFDLETKEINFLNFLARHVFLILLTTVVFFVSLNIFIKNRKTVYLIVPVFMVIIQTSGMLYSYNVTLGEKKYYPPTRLTSALRSQEPGVYLEIGNPSITENINLIYGLSSIESYDAIGVAGFKMEYDKEFSDKNQWGNPESVTESSLKKFGIKYLVSDYDLRLKKTDIQPDRGEVLAPLVKSSQIIVNFSNSNASAIRLLPATFSRYNNCNVSFQILNANHDILYEHNEKCSHFYNNMYYSFEIPQFEFVSDDEYYLKISSDSESEDNAISFYGKENSPYFSVLGENSGLDLDLLEKSKTWYLFVYPDSQNISYGGKVEVLESLPEKISFLTSSNRPSELEVKRANFKGWNVYVDGRQGKLNETHLLSVDLPEGDHRVEFVYVPFSHYAGVVVSVFSFLVLIVYFVRSLKINFFERDNKSALSMFAIKAKNIPWHKQGLFLVITGGISFGIFSIILYIFPPKSEFVSTEVVNWLNINMHFKKDDYAYFLILILGSSLTTFFAWILWIKKR